MVRPVIKDGTTLIFPNGTSRKMTLRERWLWYRGKFKEVPLSSGKRTELIGEYKHKGR